MVLLEDDIYRFLKAKVAVDNINFNLRNKQKAISKEDNLKRNNDLVKEFENIRKRYGMIKNKLGYTGESRLKEKLEDMLFLARESMEEAKRYPQ